MIKQYKFKNVFSNNKSLFTKNLVPNSQVYNEKLVMQEGIEYREWNPRRSKLGAMILNGCKIMPIKEDSKVLYLGAGSGTTASHISDIANKGIVYCIEFSGRAFLKLLKVCRKRKNMFPLLYDANQIEKYQSIVKDVDVVYQDIAQKEQTKIFLKNLVFLKKEGFGIFMVKARSIDVKIEPKLIYKEIIKELKSDELEVLESINLEPYERDHIAIIIQKKSNEKAFLLHFNNSLCIQ